MSDTGMNIAVAVLLSLGAVSCATVSSSRIAVEATPESYAASATTKGVVILAVNWGRHWACGKYENAQILSLGFDRLPVQDVASDRRAEIFMSAPGAGLLVDPVYLDYAILLEPGEYALTSFDILAARSVQDVGHFVGNRSNLIENGKSKAGSFDVKAGEVVYIGHFWLDCYEQPMPWRFYTSSRDDFGSHLARVKKKYPFIDTKKVTYRLFRTTAMGQDYELPQ
jgi:hypothetical protein